MLDKRPVWDWRLLAALLIAGLIASFLIGCGTLFLYQDRDFVFGGESSRWTNWEMDPTVYISTPLLYWLLGGLPATAISWFLVKGTGGSRRRVIAALSFGALAPVLPAWYMNSFAGPWYLAGLVALASGLVGIAPFLIAAFARLHGGRNGLPFDRRWRPRMAGRSHFITVAVLAAALGAYALALSVAVSLLYGLLLFPAPSTLIDLFVENAALCGLLAAGGAVATALSTFVGWKDVLRSSMPRRGSRKLIRAACAGPGTAAIPGTVYFVGTMGWYGLGILLIVTIAACAGFWAILTLVLCPTASGKKPGVR